MQKPYISASLLMIIVLVTGFTALYIGQRYFTNGQDRADQSNVDMHSFFHDQLGIEGEPNAQLAEIEHRYNDRRQDLEVIIREANRELADVIMNTSTYSPEVQQVIDKIHTAMGQLQKATVEHLFEMRTVLTDEQNQRFQQLITDALYENAEAEN